MGWAKVGDQLYIHWPYLGSKRAGESCEEQALCTSTLKLFMPSKHLNAHHSQILAVSWPGSMARELGAELSADGVVSSLMIDDKRLKLLREASFWRHPFTAGVSRTELLHHS